MNKENDSIVAVDVVEEKNIVSKPIDADKEKVISVNNLFVSLGDKEILTNISFNVYSNEFISIIGANGSGKTTLLKTLCRIVEKFEGEIYIKGKLLTEYQLKKLVKIQSYVSQVNITTNFTVFEFVLMSRYSYFHAFSSVSRIDVDKVNRSLELTETLGLKDRMMSTLSGGERQRVIIASAIVQDSQIILLDEPTTYLDPKYRHEINELIYKLHKNLDITVINVTHDINEAVKYSDRIICLKNGTLISDNKISFFLERGTELLANVFDMNFTSVTLKQNNNIPIFIND